MTPKALKRSEIRDAKTSEIRDAKTSEIRDAKTSEIRDAKTSEFKGERDLGGALGDLLQDVLNDDKFEANEPVRSSVPKHKQADAVEHKIDKVEKALEDVTIEEHTDGTDEHNS